MITRLKLKNQDCSGFSLTDVMFSSTILVIALMAVSWSHITGLKMHGKLGTQLDAAAHERRLWSYLNADITEAQKIKIGSMSGNSFVEIMGQAARTGSALRIYPALGNTNNYISYFLNPDKSLMRHASTDSSTVVLARHIKNTLPFRFEDRAGNMLTNSDSLFVVSILLDYSQFQNSTEKIGPNNTYQSFAHSRKYAHKRSF